MAKKNPQSLAGKLRSYISAHPKAKPQEIAAATGVDIKYVYNYRHANKLTRKYKAKAQPKKVAPPADTRMPDVGDSEEPKYFHPLFPVFAAALHQVTDGKGTRHGGDEIPFMEQPWVHYAKLHGRGFLTGQAAKKLEEAASTREGESYEHELLGAIVYTAMAVLHSAMTREETAND